MCREYIYLFVFVLSCECVRVYAQISAYAYTDIMYIPCGYRIRHDKSIEKIESEFFAYKPGTRNSQLFQLFSGSCDCQKFSSPVALDHNPLVHTGLSPLETALGKDGSEMLKWVTIQANKILNMVMILSQSK